MAGEQRPNINVTSHGQQGGITAGSVNFYAPQPGVNGQTVSENEPDSEGKFVTRTKLTLEAPYAARALWVGVSGQSIQDFHVQPTQSGVHSIEKNVGPEQAVNKVLPPLGYEYIAVVTTDAPNQLAMQAEVET